MFYSHDNDLFLISLHLFRMCIGVFSCLIFSTCHYRRCIAALCRPAAPRDVQRSWTKRICYLCALSAANKRTKLPGGALWQRSIPRVRDRSWNDGFTSLITFLFCCSTLFCLLYILHFSLCYHCILTHQPFLHLFFQLAFVVLLFTLLLLARSSSTYLLYAYLIQLVL